MRIPAALALAALTAAALTACSSGSTAPAAGQVTQPPQPPTAASVAKQLGLTGFTGCGPAPLGGVTDSGMAYKGAIRYGIDTFPSQDIRDGWVKTAAKVGVVPVWESSDWVAYKAVNQAAKGCS